MLTHPTEQRLMALGLTGMAKALEEQRRQPDVAALAFEERIAMMIDREAIERENKRLVTRLKFAGLRQTAVVEDVDMKAPRGLDKALFARLVCRRLDRPASEPDRHWADRRRQKLDRLRARLTRRAATIAPCSIIACHGCSMRWHLPAAMAVMRGCSRPSPASRCSFSMIGGSPASPPDQGRDLLEIVDDRHGRGTHHRHQPAPRRALARGDRQPDRRRRHPRPPRPQRPSPHVEGRQPAQGRRQTCRS